MKHKYPIGTNIKFIFPSFDKGKIGTIVAIRECDGYPYIYLPKAPYVAYKGKMKYSYICLWTHIEPIGQRQLEFDFMY